MTQVVAKHRVFRQQVCWAMRAARVPLSTAPRCLAWRQFADLADLTRSPRRDQLCGGILDLLRERTVERDDSTIFVTYDLGIVRRSVALSQDSPVAGLWRQNYRSSFGGPVILTRGRICA